jgi:hypothetical protein
MLADTDPDLPLDRVLAYARRHRGHDALAALTAAAYLAETEDAREAAVEGAAELRAVGVAPPTWAHALGTATAGRCLLVRDVYGEETTVVCEFTRDGERDALYVVIDHEDVDGVESDAWVGTEPNAIIASVTEQVAESDGLQSMTEVSPAEAAETIRSGLAALDDVVPPESEEFTRFRALVLARLRDMPGRPVPAAEEPPELDDAALAGLRDEFLGSADLPDTQAVREAAELIVDANQDLRIGPRRLDRFLHSGYAGAALDEPAREAFPAVIVAWTRYAAARAGLPEHAVKPLVELATGCGPHGVEAPEPDTTKLIGTYYPELSELPAGHMPDPDTIADIVARRLFALPDVPDGLHPADPDDRRAAIAAEHPGYADAEDLPDGVDPRLHLALHELVAGQLWHGDPPQAWQAARRLLDAGHDETDVRHTLTEVAARHLTDTPPGARIDTAKYATDLDALS